MTTDLKKDAGGFARVVENVNGTSHLLIGQHFIRDGHGEDEAIDLKMDAENINTAFSSRVRPLVDGLEKIIKHQQSIAKDLAGFSTTVQIAKKALEEFRGGK